MPAGSRFPDRLELIEHILQGQKGHKVALNAIAKGGAIIRYSEIIGYTLRATAASVGRLHLQGLSQPRRQRRHQEPARHHHQRSLRVAGVVEFVVKLIERDLLPKYPNVDGVVGPNHLLYGCGVAINAPATVPGD